MKKDATSLVARVMKTANHRAPCAVAIFLGLLLNPDSVKSQTWEQTIVAANREGKVVIYGPPGADLRDALTKGFQKKYPDIKIEYTGGANPQLTPKLVTEAQAGLHVADVHIGGTTSPVAELLPRNILAPLHPFLVGPEASNPSKWKGGKYEFADEAGKQILVFALLAHPGYAYNKNTVDASSVKSWKELLNPKWKGKMSMWDPRRPGAGLAMAAFAYFSEELGPEYLRQLFKQDIVYHASEGARQALEWVASGKYPINLATSTRQATELIAKGLPIELAKAALLKEGTWLTPGGSAVMVVNGAPHPNAVKVYLDWLLSREAQLAHSKAIDHKSLRVDVPSDFIHPALVPQEGGKYVDYDYKEAYQRKKATEITDFVTIEIAKVNR